MLDRIPTEILSLILNKTPRISDLKSLSLTSRAISVVAAQHLYHNFTLYCSEDANFTDLIKQRDEFPMKRLSGVREFAVRMPIWELTHERCVDDRDPDMLPRVNESLEKLISRIPENTLRSFRWDTGTCLPEHILSPNGVLVKQQRNLEALYLTTDPCCIPSDDPIIDLTSFTNLKSLTWRGICNPVYFEALAPFFQSEACAGKLETLELDFVSWKDAERNWRHHDTKYTKFKGNFFSEHILGQGKCVLESLRNLSLTDVSFGSAVKQLIKSLNIKKLSRLKLVTCPFSLDLFDEVTEVYGGLSSIKALELVIDRGTRYSKGEEDPDRDDDQYADTLPTMIRFCESLEDLFIVITELDDYETMYNTLEDLRKSLKRILYCEYMEGFTGAKFWPRGRKSSWGVVRQSNNQESLYMPLFSLIEEYSEDEHEEIVKVSQCPLFHIRERGHVLDHDMHTMCHVDTMTPLPELKSLFRPLEYNVDGSIVPLTTWRMQTWLEDDEIMDKRPSFHGICPTTNTNQRSRYVARRDPFTVASSRFLDYATELFSPRGQPGLKVLAYGDFSMDGRWADQNVFLVRDEGLKDAGGKYNFRLINDQDIAAWDLIDENMDFLGSCPSTRILSTVNIYDDWTEEEDEEEHADNADGDDESDEEEEDTN
ncbi:hypothetical protein VTL71DRAFT_16568 [Oculimacula yallundae]|uniref:F-box domain-containing protein n=1 Tax=Oculimacula yallundae TaxID=86028 RepID=A0ABR4CFF0_9HELO